MPFPRTVQSLLVLLCIGCARGLIAAPHPSTNQTDRVQEAVTGRVPIGRLPATQSLNLAIGLPLRNQKVLNNLLNQLYDPSSPSYHQWLSVAQFTEDFGPTVDDYMRLVDQMRSQGLGITATYPNRMLLNVSGSVADIERVFGVTLQIYQHPTEGRTFFAPSTAPALDLAAPVLHVSGLDDFERPRPASLAVRTNTPPPGAEPLAGAGPSGSYLAADLRAAYASGVALTGAGQYVGLLQFDGYYPSDITSYATIAGLTNLPLQNVLLDEVTGTPGVNNVEVALDIEMALAMAPGLAGVIVYQGALGNSILNRMAVDNVAKQLSASWTFPTDAVTEQIYQQLAAQGQSYFNASGDSGAYPGSPPTPTDSLYVTSVGGTTLSTRGPGQNWLSEKTWSWIADGTGTGASSGGVSARWTIPSWQQGLDTTTNHGSTTMRNIPDVAMVSDKVLIIANNGAQQIVGGDSVAAPLWAAFIALVNQQSSLNGLPSAGFVNPAIYAIGKSATYATAFHDIKTGNNTNSSSPNNYFAVAGYDLCTGWGTPNGKGLINALSPPPNSRLVLGAGATLSLETCPLTNGTVNPGEVVILNFALQNFGAVNASSLVATLQSNASVQPLTTSQSYGTLVGGGAAVSRPFILTPNGTCGENANFTLELKDGTNVLPNVVFTLPLGTATLALSQNFDSVAAPALPAGWGRTTTGVASNWVTTSSFRYSTANSVYVPGADNAGISELNSPAISIATPTAQLSFRNSYVTEIDPTNSANAFDGGLLEIKIGADPFVDILAAGGSFVSGGYTRTLDATTGNTLPGQAVWAGTSGSFIPTIINLPASAAGQTIRLKWRLSTDIGNAAGGTFWYLDNIAIKDGASCCAPAAIADLTVSQGVFPNPGLVGQSVAYSISITNLGPGPATSFVLADSLPPNSTFVFASPGCVYTNGQVLASFPLLISGGRTNFTIVVAPTAEGVMTNLVNVASAASDPDSTNSSSVALTTVYAPPVILTNPASQTTQTGSNVTFNVVATGTAPLSYQWTWAGTNLNGQTAPVLLLTNVQPVQAGSYGVQITNLYGSASSLANLKILVPPTVTLTALDVSPTNVTVSLLSVSGLSYTLEYKNSLLDELWTPLLPPSLGNGNILTLQDTNGAIGLSRFYRVNCY